MMTNADSNLEMGTITIESIEHRRKALPGWPNDWAHISGRTLLPLMTTAGGHSGHVRPHVNDGKV